MRKSCDVALRGSPRCAATEVILSQLVVILGQRSHVVIVLRHVGVCPTVLDDQRVEILMFVSASVKGSLVCAPPLWVRAGESHSLSVSAHFMQGTSMTPAV